MPLLSEDKIIDGCLKADRAAQKALYDLYKTKMYTLACRITGNKDDAGDVLQEGFLEVFNNLTTFKRESLLGTWIHTIITRAALKKIRDRIIFEDLIDIPDNDEIDWGPDVDVNVLEMAINELPTGYRSIFTLFEIEGFKHVEIAQMMGISVSTSKTQLHKAKRMLISKLKEK